MSVKTTEAGLAMYVSWNGATNVSSWSAMGGPSESNLSPIANASRSGFETIINATANAFVSVAALDASVSSAYDSAHAAQTESFHRALVSAPVQFGT
jgi:hypothetical protein